MTLGVAFNPNNVDEKVASTDHDNKSHRLSHSNVARSNSSSNGSSSKQQYRKESVRQRLMRQVPIIQHISDRFHQLPSHYKYGCFVCWMTYKVMTALLVILFFHNHNTTIHQPKDSSMRDLITTSLRKSPVLAAHMNTHGMTNVRDEQRILGMQDEFTNDDMKRNKSQTRILYIVTSLSEYNNGRRSTIAGQDRLGEIVLPILIDSIQTIVSIPHYQVDVYLILAYTLQPHREQMIRSRLPPNVGLQIWDDACPLGYDTAAKKVTNVINNTRTLARQHRYVIKDKLPYYDVFVAFEDDMRITGTHIQHFLTMSTEIDNLRKLIEHHDAKKQMSVDQQNTTFFGTITSRQVNRLIPGFVRVEVMLNESENGAQLELDPIPLDYTYDGDHENSEFHFDPQPCCHVNMNPNIGTPTKPSINDVVLWETSVKALSVRQLPVTSTNKRSEPNLDWVVLLPGPGKRLQPDDIMNSYWSGIISKNNVWKVRPSPGEPELIAQQGGWMATKEQIIRLNYQPMNDMMNNNEHVLCQGSFLPPFDRPIYRSDGQESMNVE
jgi:hypothetical protein